MKTIFNFKTCKTTIIRLNSVLCISVLFLASCSKTKYLDVQASDRPALAAKISFVNARPINQSINFYTYTTQVTATPVAMNTATPYLDAQFGLVQINIAAAGSTSYLASRVFGGSASFTANGGPNGPIAGYNHTVFATKSLASGYTADSLILFYDDLSAPLAGMAKIRFVNLTPNVGPVNLSFAGTKIFSKVNYGYAGGEILSGDSLSAYSIGPFTSIAAGAGKVEIISSITGSAIDIKDSKIDNFTFAEGKVYTVFISGNPQGEVIATVLQHN